MKLFEKPSVHRHGLLVLGIILALSGCQTSPQKSAASEPAEETVSESATKTSIESTGDLMGEWCYIKKKRVTRYTVKEGVLQIRTGRSGQYHKADLTCDDAYTECKAKTMRGWGTPVSETLRLDGETMKLTRVWGGAWNDKTYNFTYTRCPKW